MKILVLIVTFFIAATLTATGQNFLKRQGYKNEYYKSIRYGLFVPPDYDPKKSYPLIVYLHGSRDTVSRDMSWYQPAFQREHPCIVITPKCTEPNLGWGDTWSNRMTKETRTTLELVDSLTRKYSINKNRLYLYGISMGGFGTFFVLSQESNPFAAAYAVCGGSDVKAADKVMQAPLWIFHGDIDDVVPVRLSREIHQEIISRGGRLVRYTEYPGVRHNSWENVADEKTLVPWLFAQEKGKTHSVPDAPTNLTATKAGNNSIILKWTAPKSGAAGDKQLWYYKIFRNDMLIGEAEGDASEFAIENAPAPSTYKVVAVNFYFKESTAIAYLK